MHHSRCAPAAGFPSALPKAGTTPRRVTVPTPRHRRGPRKHRSAASALPALLAHKQALRRTALRDCSQRCVYCASPLTAQTATLDHVHPRSLGGAHDPANLVTACGPCNRLKGDLLPYEFFLYHPWAGQHFLRYARAVHRALKRVARRAVSLAYANA